MLFVVLFSLPSTNLLSFPYSKTVYIFDDVNFWPPLMFKF